MHGMSIIRRHGRQRQVSTPHGENRTTNIAGGTCRGNSKSLLIENKPVGNVFHIQQDGGQMEISESYDEQLFGSDQVSTPVKAETTVTANPEWIKTAFDQLGPIFSVTTNQIDDKQLANDHDVCMESVVTHVSTANEMFYPVQTSTISEKSTSGSSSVGVNVAKSVKRTKVVPKKKIQVSTTKSILCLHGDSSNSPQVAGLDDLQDVPNLDLNDKEILQSTKLDLCDIDEDQSTPLISTQELTVLPDKGLGFDESVTSKATLEDTASELDNFVSSLASDELGSELACLEQDGGIEKSVGNVNLDIFRNAKYATAGGGKNEKDSKDESAAMATISISTDKATNTTQILINTGHGQQLFQINTADLAQATTALEPLALQGGMVGFDSNGHVLNTGTVNGITVQDGYLLIPVSQTEGEGGVLLQTATLQTQDGEGDGTGDSSGAKKLYICEEEGCGKVFAKLSKLKIHHMQHTGERPFKCSVPGCDWAFMTGYKLKRHMESHEKRKDFVCQVEGCGRKFTTIYNLNTHMKLHQRPKTEKCELCGEMFPTVRKLDIHMINSHKDAERLFKCMQKGCDKKFFSSHMLHAHLKVHMRRKEIVCEFEGCGKIFDKQCRLKQHMRLHTGEKPYICSVEGCGWAFGTASKLKRHQQKHTGERKWICPHEDCDKSFMRAEHLKGHLVTHTGEKPFFCSVPGCEARFAAKSSMYVHVKKHEQQVKEGKVTYFCPMEGCERKYNNKNTLRQHISKHYHDTITQAQNMGITPVVQTAELQESLIATGFTGVTIPAATVGGTTTHADGSTSINPADLINVGTQVSGSVTTCTSDLVTNPTTLTQFIVSNELTQQLQQQQQQQLQNPRSLLANNVLLAANSGVMTTIASGVDSKPVITISPEEIENSSGGSARTDSYSNRLLSDRARHRRKLLREKANLSSAGVRDEVLTAAAEYPTSEMLTSRGLPIRDPDTGALYVQTQLLQDDPPNADMYTDETGEQLIGSENSGGNIDSNGVVGDSSGITDGENSGLGGIPGANSMDHPGLSNDLSLEVHTDLEPHATDFTGSTINLQDLE